ncbi:MAG TPA: cytochrome c [Stellaceae bacterium]|nr:cytochrome c [Stellaceae bacterium]
MKLVLVTMIVLLAGRALAADEAAVARGAILFAAADCTGCHTDAKNGGAFLAGGRALATPFGTFYGPNITPDRTAGIGAWSEAEFRRALRDGKDDEGAYLFPVFPYPSFTGMSDADIADLYAFLMAQKPAATAKKPHEVSFPFGWRFLQLGWRSLFFAPGPLTPDKTHDETWNRGRYLAESVAHCQECHTTRNILGGLASAVAYAGNPHGPDGQKAPNITSDPATGIGKWSLEEVTNLLKTGQTPEFDFVGSGMADVVRGTGALSDQDRLAIAVYIKSLPPRPAMGK